MTIPAPVRVTLSWPMTEFDALCANDSELAEIREAMREFLAADRAEFGWEPAVDSWLARWDADFSARLGDAGFVGLTIPNEYGGRRLGHLHRYVVTEELLAQGRPSPRTGSPIVSSLCVVVIRHRGTASRVAAGHRRGPDIRRDRDEGARRGVRPGSGQDAGDADRRRMVTDAEPRCGPAAPTWPIGSSCWPAPARSIRNTGMPDSASSSSQWTLPGITIDPIVQMGGEHHFNEVTFEEVFVSDADVFGSIGDGWRQVTSELGFERSGPERFLSTVTLILAADPHTRPEKRSTTEPPSRSESLSPG